MLDINLDIMNELAMPRDGTSVDDNPETGSNLTKPASLKISDYGTASELAAKITAFFGNQDQDLLVIQGEVKNNDSVRKLMHTQHMIATARNNVDRISSGERLEVNRKDVVILAHMQKHDTPCGVTQSCPTQFSANWRLVTVDTVLADSNLPTIKDMLETNAKVYSLW